MKRDVPLQVGIGKFEGMAYCVLNLKEATYENYGEN